MEIYERNYRNSTYVASKNDLKVKYSVKSAPTMNILSKQCVRQRLNFQNKQL